MYNINLVVLLTSIRVYGPRDTQETVFADIKPLLTSLLDG